MIFKRRSAGSDSSRPVQDKPNRNTSLWVGTRENTDSADGQPSALAGHLPSGKEAALKPETDLAHEDASGKGIGATKRPSLLGRLRINKSIAALQVASKLIHSTRPTKLLYKTRWSMLAGSLLVSLVVAGLLVWNGQHQDQTVTIYRVGAERSANLFAGGGGIIYPQQQLTITYPATERVTDVKVAPGERVQANQELIKLDPAQINTSIKQAADDLAAAQNYLNAVAGAGNAVTVAQAREHYEQTKGQYDALIARSSSAILRDGSLVSPIDGVITAINVNPGAIFTENMPLLTVTDLSVVTVHVKVPLAYLGQVQLQQEAQVIPSAASHQSFRGTVTSIIPQADPQTDTFEVWIKLDNKEGKLLPGMSAFVRIQQPLKALAVPRLAVLAPDGDASVFVIHDGIAHQRQVQVVGRNENTIYLRGEIAQGDQIVLVGLDKLHEGQKVHVAKVEG